jgi:hypothetical protein
LPGRAGFLDAPVPHHPDPLGEVLHQAEVVRDQGEGQAFGSVQLEQQLQDLSADGDVESAQRLVAHQQPRTVDDPARQRHALPLPAGQLVRVLLGAVAVQANLVQDLGHPPPVVSGQAQRGQRLSDDAADRPSGVQ